MSIFQNKLLQLHSIILLWGLTPVIGKFVSLQATDLVWYRLIFSAISLYLFMRYKKIKIDLPLKQLGVILGMGCVVGLHWFFFYHAIKVSNVSIALSGFASMTLFASILQPLMLKRAFFWGDIFYGLVILIGLIIIVNFESSFTSGLLYGILAAFTGAIFGIYNGKLIKKHDASTITLFEFIGAFALISIMKLMSDDGTPFVKHITPSDWIGLLILSILCTTVAFTWSIHILKYFSPFTVIITNNLEPVYGILFSIILFGETEMMSPGFYMGTLIILSSVFTYPILKRKYHAL